MKKIEFEIMSQNKFGIIRVNGFVPKCDDLEDTFRSILLKMNKRDSENWISLEFTQDGQFIEISRCSWVESGFDFSLLI